MDLPKYREWVKTLPCAHCHSPLNVDPHHIISVDKMGAIGMQQSDITIMPLCRTHHNDLHADAGQGWPQTRWMIETQLKALKAIADGELIL